MHNSPLPGDKMTAAAAAKFLGVGRPCIWRWVLKGRIPGWRIGERLYVSEADIRAQIRQVEPPGCKAPEPVTVVTARRHATEEGIRRHRLSMPSRPFGLA